MATMIEIPVIDVPAQRLETTLNGTQCALSIRHNETSGAWSLSVEIGGTEVLSGVRIVPGVDLLAGYDLGLGKLAVFDWDGTSIAPDRAALPSGAWRLMGYWE